MGLLKNIILIGFVLFAGYIYQKYQQLHASAPKPHLDENYYWGPGNGISYVENKAIVPFEINTPVEIINTLSTQLNRTIVYEKPLENVAFEYGYNNDALKDVVKYWKDTYLPKWSEREKYLNKFPQFKTQIQGLNIHFIHVKPNVTAGEKVFPLLLLHGWPGSVREFYDIIPLLTEPNPKSDYVFEVIVPSLVGFGFSDPARKVGHGAVEMAVVMRNLMLRLGHKKFLIQGGDWGSFIGSFIAALYDENVLGYHSNLLISQMPISLFKLVLAYTFPTIFLEKEQYGFYKPFGEWFSYTMEESGYMHIQATKPDTIGVTLSNNPVGLAAYILEKFSTWTNTNYKHLPDGGITKRYSLDALLDNVMIYYITNSITTSERLYSETFNVAEFSMGVEKIHIHVPTGGSRFLYDLVHVPDWILADRFKNLIYTTYHHDGGHFAAMELPNVLYEDFIKFVHKLKLKYKNF